MKQQETEVSLDGNIQKLVYRVVHTDQGTLYEGLVGKLPFFFSIASNQPSYSGSFEDPSVREPVIAAVLGHHQLQNALTPGSAVIADS